MHLCKLVAIIPSVTYLWFSSANLCAVAWASENAPDTAPASRITPNGVVISKIAERYRVRHELSRENFNNFNIEYWNARFGYFELYDYTRPQAAQLRQQACNTSQPCVVVKLFSQTPMAMQDNRGEKDCNQQVPNWRYHKEFGNETNFLFGAVMDIILPNGSTVSACQASRQQRSSATSWQAIMRPWPNISRSFSQGEQIEFETTITFDRAVIFGDNVNYYGQTYRYVLGQGFVNNNRDPAIGPTNINDRFAQLGGETTIPQLAQTGGEQVRLSYMQHAYNLSSKNVQSWLNGRRLFHTDFASGAHIEQLLPGPQAISGNLPFPQMAGLATNPIQNSCIQCHILNGNGPLQTGSDVVPPKLIGLGLLESIPEQQIRNWAQENGGTIREVSVRGQSKIGRFGWRALTSSITQQTAKALHDDMGVGTSFPGFGPQELSNKHLQDLVTYMKLLAVPTPRQNLTLMRGHQHFQQFGCNNCHKMTVTTGSQADFPELSQEQIHPYTDLLLHDLGEGLFRTAPLWGMGLSGYVRSGNYQALRLMHDGQARSIDEVMRRHQNEAQAQSAAYFNAPSNIRQELIEYLMAL